jgi:epsilon-lactone hydrolase
MTVAELEVVRRMLRETDLQLAGPAEVGRANFEALLSHLPVMENVAFETTVLGGVPALRAHDPEVDSQRILLYLHGGAYTAGSPNGYRSLWSTLAHAANAQSVAIDYRMAPEEPFPAAVDDAVAGYSALLEEGHAPEQIAVAGDSAGGGLTVSMMVAARDRGLPLPAAGVCLSPWADLTCSGNSYRDKALEDLSLNTEELTALAERYAGDQTADPLASPVRADLTGLPPLLIQVGSVEILLDDAVSLARQAGAAGVQTTLEVWPGMPHVWHSFGFMLSEGADATKTAGRFMRTLTKG